MSRKCHKRSYAEVPKGRHRTSVPHPFRSNFGIEWPRLQVYSLSQSINKYCECRDPSEQLVVRRHKVPRCPLGRSLFYHIFYRDFVVRPAFPIAEVFVGKLPAFERIIYSVLEPANLLASRDVQENLRCADAVLD